MPAPTWWSSTPAASSTTAVAESLDAIGEALAENGKVIVTGCLGAKTGDGGAISSARRIRGCWPSPARTRTHEVMAAVHAHLPKPHDPFADLVPPQGIKLTPRHYAYLKISEGCNHRCSFCIIPAMRGDLVSAGRSARCSARRGACSSPASRSCW